MWQKKGSAHDPKHKSSSVKHSGGSVMVWGCMAASGVGPTHDVSSRMNSEISKNILSANLQRNASKLIGRNSQNTLLTQQRTSLWKKVEGFT